MNNNKKYSFWHVLRYQISMIGETGNRALFLMYPLNMLFAGVLPVIAVVLPRYIIDAIVDNDINGVWLYVSLFAGISMILSIYTVSVKHSVENRAMQMRLRQFSKYHEKYKYAAYSALEDADFQAKRSVAMRTLSDSRKGFQGAYIDVLEILPNIVTIILFIIILGIVNPWIIIIASISALLQFFLHLYAKKMAYSNKEELAEAERKSKYFYNIGCDFAYGKDIRMNQYTERLTHLHKEKSGIYQKIFRRFQIHEYGYSLFDLLFAFLTNGAAYYFVIKAYFAGLLTIGEMSMTIWTVIAVSLLLQKTATKMASLLDSTKYTASFLEFMDTEAYFPKTGDIQVKDLEMGIEFNNVSFKYPNTDKYVLKDITLSIKPGERLALVGLNGSGKTTLVKLLSGFYKPTSGTIMINGKNIEKLDMTEYVEELAVVFQDVNIYAATVLENLVGIRKSETDLNKAKTALNEVDLSEKIDKLPKQIQTQMLKIIDTDGIELSGGESQKLAIARALVKDLCKLIILDEPTASLDAIAERELYEKFEGLIRNRTAIIISHRLASTRFCDKVAFLKEGELTEYGSHEELMSRDTGEYRNMFLVQGKYYREVKSDEALANI